jgi:hypothetical protein
LVEASPGPPLVVTRISAKIDSRKMVSIMITTAIGRARCGRTMKKNIDTGFAPSMRAASTCSRSSDWIAVRRISVANGTHCQATMMPIEVSGQTPNQSTTPRCNERVMNANSPLTGCIRRFFQINALTVGMTKNGAITSRRATERP